MEFDLTFTKDEQWIAGRKKTWEKIKDDVVEDLTKKQVKSVEKYFFTGIPDRQMKNWPSALLCFFPSCSREAMSFVFFEYTVLKGTRFENLNFRRIQNCASMNLDSWPDASREDKLNLFKMFFGETYDPNQKFPFLIGDETEYRDYSYTAGGLLHIMLDRFVGWCRTDEEGILVWPDLVDYMLSIIPYADPWIFKKNLSEGEKQSDLGGGDVDGFSAKLEELMQYILIPGELFEDNLYTSLRLEKLQQIGEYLHNLEGPQELVRHWQWAKKEFSGK